MAKLSWVTETNKTIANCLIGVNSSIQLVVYDADHTGEDISFTKVLGDLPPGLALSSVNVGTELSPQWVGVISGTPIYSTPSDNYFVSREYTFHIMARGETGSSITNYFKIIITNTVNGDFTWVTPAGSLGTAPTNEFYALQLQAQGPTGFPITYSFVSGELPDGMQLVSTGYLQGVPTFLNAVAVNQSQSYRFTVRASLTRNSITHVLDRSFSLAITNALGTNIQPEAKTTYDLGAYFDGTYYAQQLYVDSANPSATIKWSVVDPIKNPLPNGLTIDENGLLSGFILPLELAGEYGPSKYSGTTITGEIVNAGSFVAKEAYIINAVGSTDFTLCGASSNTAGVEFVATNPGSGSGTAYYSNTAIVSASQEFSYGPYDFNRSNQNANYNFTVQAFDGANYDIQQYVIKVFSRSSFSADSSIKINNTYLTVDSIDQNIPILTTTDPVLPSGRQNSYYAFKFNGIDLQDDTFTFSLANTEGTFDSGPFDPLERSDFNNGLTGSFDNYDPEGAGTNNLPGLLLDPNTGWLYGKIDQQTESLTTTTFGVIVSKVVNTVTLSSIPRYFTLPVLGDVNNIITWTTPSNLGSIDNGTVSELSVKATSRVGKALKYSLLDEPNLSAALPQGLSLLPSGDISGRVSFEVFTIDKTETTFDGKSTTIDKIFNFTVKVETDDATYDTDGTILTNPTSTATRQFTLELNIINIEPYENLYLRAMPAYDQRQIYNSIINNSKIFDPDKIYRPTDPWFGVKKNIETLFLPGLTAETLDAYQTAIERNHWKKTYSFGDIKTAVVLDDSYNIKYEVVYIDINDPAENSSGLGAGLELDLNGIITNPYIDANGVEHTVVYPNSSENMIKRLEDGIGYTDQSSLPPWMTSNQPDLADPNKFKIPLGYTKAVVLAYTVPGAAKLIAYRLKAEGINFNRIEFSVDRYRVDNFYSKYFNSTTNDYIKVPETTFDYLPSKNAGSIVTRVNYATIKSFSQINGRTISYITNTGGIDGINNFESGQTIIFAKQEGFVDAGPYSGWVTYTNAVFGDNITPISYDSYTIVPGYLEKIQSLADVNKRSSVWQINIVDNVVSLTFVTEVLTNQRVQIVNGRSYAGAILYYDPILSVGQTVPEYHQFDASKIIVGRPTTFNNGSTKFTSNRDRYYAPGSQDKYLSFPQHGVFK